MRTRLLTYISCLLLAGCSEVKFPQADPLLVIDGWIEPGKGPVVMVSSSVPVDQVIRDDEELKKYIVTWCKVSVSDGEREVVLTGMVNDDYFPPYIYTTSSIKGVAGKTYTLTVEEYKGRKVTAVTTIPEPVQLEKIKVNRSKLSDDSYYLTGIIKDNPATKDYFKVFVKTDGKDSTYVPSFLGLFDDEILNSSWDEIPIYNRIDNNDKSKSTSFTADDNVMVRFCTLDETAHNYWSDFDDITMSQNPLFPVTSKIRSNIRGGLGHWSGYGSSYYKVSIADSLALGRAYDAE